MRPMIAVPPAPIAAGRLFQFERDRHGHDHFDGASVEQRRFELPLADRIEAALARLGCTCADVTRAAVTLPSRPMTASMLTMPSRPASCIDSG